MKVDIKGIDKAELLAGLYNNSKVQGSGFLGQLFLGSKASMAMTKEEAQKELEKTTYFDYLHGKVMKVELGGDELETIWYDRDNGEGTAARVVEQIRLGADADLLLLNESQKKLSAVNKNLEENLENIFKKAHRSELKSKPVLIMAIDKAKVLLALYNNAVNGKGNKQLAHAMMDKSFKEKNFYYDTVDLGCGPCQLQVDLDGIEIDPTAYDKRYGYNAAAETINKLQNEIITTFENNKAEKQNGFGNFAGLFAFLNVNDKNNNDDAMEIEADPSFYHTMR